jgi:hypothetical protein
MWNVPHSLLDMAETLSPWAKFDNSPEVTIRNIEYAITSREQGASSPYKDTQFLA